MVLVAYKVDQLEDVQDTDVVAYVVDNDDVKEVDLSTLDLLESRFFFWIEKLALVKWLL